MKYRTMEECVHDLYKHNDLLMVEEEVDPYIEMGIIQRRAYKKKSPAILFTKVKNSPFPALANVYGTRERVEFLFRDSIASLRALLSLKADPMLGLKKPLYLLKALSSVWSTRPKIQKRAPILKNLTTLSQLPQLVSWKEDGGAYITLPEVYTQDPEGNSFSRSNLGMYRIQISSKYLVKDAEVGLHYQIHRGIAAHHAKALKNAIPLPINIFIGGPLALAISAVMPLPEDIPEIFFAGALSGFRIPYVHSANGLLMPVEADFCISGYLVNENKPEGPFGDHLGYYSLEHEFPIIKVENVYHRKGAIFPFTTVGRPPQEDTVFGEFIHDITQDVLPQEFKGITQVNAVDCAGVHPLLLAIGKERYVPYAEKRRPQEIITLGLSLLGKSQTSLAKYLFIVAEEDAVMLSAHDIKAFFEHMLERTDFSRDIHFITRTTIDTLDYTGSALNEGSKMLWAVAGEKKRELARELPIDFSLPKIFSKALLFSAGIVLIEGEKNVSNRDEQSMDMKELVKYLSYREMGYEGVGLCVVVDDINFVMQSLENFLWVTFTRSHPSTDIYGMRERIENKHWACCNPLLIDARIKPFHAPPLLEDTNIERRVEECFATRGKCLHGYI
ncbi:MAG: UbiD family decarboxylase [Desulfovibrionaceae bacterium]